MPAEPVPRGVLAEREGLDFQLRQPVDQLPDDRAAEGLLGQHGAQFFDGAVNMLLAATGRPMLVTLVDDQVWVSPDHGTTWARAASGEVSGSITALAFSAPGAETSVLAGLYEGGVVTITLPDAST